MSTITLTASNCVQTASCTSTYPKILSTKYISRNVLLKEIALTRVADVINLSSPLNTPITCGYLVLHTLNTYLTLEKLVK